MLSGRKHSFEVNTTFLSVLFAQSYLTICDPWPVAHQAPLFMEFSRQEHWFGLLFLSPEDLPNPGIEPMSPELQKDSLPSEPPGKPYDHTNICQMFLWIFQHIISVCFLNKTENKWKTSFYKIIKYFKKSW